MSQRLRRKVLGRAPICTAKSSRTGKPCKRHAIAGGVVCPTHGGRAPQVKAAAAQRVKDILDDAIDPNRMLRECARIAYFDPRKLFDDKGNVLPPSEWPDDVAAAVAGLEVVVKNLTTGDGKVDEVIKPRIWDKVKALEMLFKHKGLLKESVEHGGAIEISWKGQA